MSTEHLATYLNDHIAGASSAIEMLEYLQRETPELDGILAGLKQEIFADREQLVSLMGALKIPLHRIRNATSRLIEKFTEGKLGFDDPSGGPLQRLESLEGISLGIEGKLALWNALAAAAKRHPELDRLDYAALALRAREQRARIEPLRLQAAEAALGLDLEHQA